MYAKLQLSRLNPKTIAYPVDNFEDNCVENKCIHLNSAQTPMQAWMDYLVSAAI